MAGDLVKPHEAGYGWVLQLVFVHTKSTMTIVRVLFHGNLSGKGLLLTSIPLAVQNHNNTVSQRKHHAENIRIRFRYI